MKYDEYKEQTDRLAERKPEVEEKIAEIRQKASVVDDVMRSEYDNEVLAAIQMIDQTLRAEAEAAETEHEELDEQKEKLQEDIQEAIQENQQALNKIHVMSDTAYGGSFSETEQKIQERISQLQSLLNNLDSIGGSNAETSGSLVGANSGLADGHYSESVFSGNASLSELTLDTKMEDLTSQDFQALTDKNPTLASRMMTDYNNRNIPKDNLEAMSRNLTMDNGGQLLVLDHTLSPDKVTVYDRNTKQYFTIYPNPQGRTFHMRGQQGQNRFGMQEDCGIASTAKGINDLYGKEVINENRLASYAVRAGKCSIVRRQDGSIDYVNSGGTIETNVKDFFEANGIKADAYTGNKTPTVETIADALRKGDVATVAVNHDLIWFYDEAQSFDPKMIDKYRYNSDGYYRNQVNTFMKIKKGSGNFRADHFVNVSNAVYDNNGVLTHFIVSDTGNGTTKMIPVAYLQRAYQGSGRISVSAQGCVIGRRRV